MNNQIDFKIFENTDEKCTLNEDNINEDQVVVKCSHLLRIAVSLQYYQLLSSFTDNKESISRDIFIEFMTNTYTTFLNDYIHLISNHSSHILAIGNDLKKYHKFRQCEINKCKFTQRRYRNRDRGNDENDGSEPHNFHIDLFDTIHFYMAHLSDTGLRIVKHIYTPTTKKEILDDNQDLDCIDHAFKEMTKQIKIKQAQCGLDVGRLNNHNSKFTISAIQTQQNSPNRAADKNEDPFIDYMFDALNHRIENIKEKQLFFLNLAAYFEQEEYDTEAIYDDLFPQHDEQSNIYCHIEKMEKYYMLKEDIYNYTINPPDETAISRNLIELDFGEHVIYWNVKPKFNSMKEEWVTNEFFPIEQNICDSLYIKAKVIANQNKNKTTYNLLVDDILCIKV
eukprot:234112_1